MDPISIIGHSNETGDDELGYGDEEFHTWLDEYEKKHGVSNQVSTMMPQYHLTAKTSLKRIWQNMSCLRTDNSFVRESYLLPKSSRSFIRMTEKLAKEAEPGEKIPDISCFPLTFLPNFIVEELVHNTDAFFSMPLQLSSYAVFFMADVSGFTHLTETYGRKELSGADELATDLNKFMSNLASTIMAFGGDILRFAGDAYLCQWEGKQSSDLIPMAEQAYRCAVHIQTVPSDTCQMLRVKIGISLGDTNTMIMGSPSESLLFVVTGKGILQVRQAEEYCKPNDIIISEEIYQCIHAKGLIKHNKTFLKGGFVQVSGFQPNPALAIHTPSLMFDGSRIELFEKCNRQSITLARAFLIPILRDVKTVDQLNYLSEVCRVTIVFVLLPKVDVTNPDILQPAYQKILSCVKNFGGVLNKVVLFDKGCSYLIVFGLPGVKHLNDAARAVICADAICTTMSDFTDETSIGISTGACFCGIVGHAQRQEYTVIGARVNMASRLMTVYHDEPVVLDNDTYHLCQQEIGERCFVTIEKRKLKGIENVPTLFAYRKTVSIQGAHRISVHHPQEIVVISEKMYTDIQMLLVSLLRTAKIIDLRKEKLIPAISVVGEQGSGKSFFLYYATEIALALNYQVLTCSALSTSIPQPFRTISRVLRQFFHYLSYDIPKKEKAVLQFVEDPNDPYLCLLNHLLNVEFPLPQDFVVQIEVINYEIHRLFYSMIRKIFRPECGYKMFIGIDSADDIDPYSWRLLKELAEKEYVVIMLNFLKDFKPPCSAAAQMKMNACHTVHLEKFSENLLVPMVCWYLDVVGVHKHVKSFLQYHASGNTQLLEELLMCPLVADQLRIRRQSEVDPEDLERNFFMCNKISLATSNEDEACERNVCDVMLGAKNWMSTSFKFQDVVKQRLSILSIQNRVVLKRAAVLGHSFTLKTLGTISYDVTHQEFHALIGELISQNIFCISSEVPSGCDSIAIYRKHPFIIRVDSVCGLISTKQQTPYVPKEASMWTSQRRLQFSTMAFRKYVLECMTKEQRINMHLDVAKHLEENGLLCASCRQGSAMLKSRFSHSSLHVEASALSRKCLQIPVIDMRECDCLIHQTETYCLISTLHADIHQLLNPIKFLIKAAESANAGEHYIKALAFIDYALRHFPMSGVLQHYKPGREEFNVVPHLLEASLLQVKAVSCFHLNNMYNAALFAFRAMEVLDVNILGFLRGSVKKQMNYLIRACSLQTRGSLAKCLSVLAKIYHKRQEFKIAFRLAKYQMLLVLHCEADFILEIEAQTLFYEFKCVKYPLQSNHEIQNRLLEDCHEHMMYSPLPTTVLELKAIAKTYIAIISHNLNYGKLQVAESFCAEAYRVFKLVHDNVNMPDILALAVQIGLHRESYSSLIMYLKNLRYVSIEIKSKSYLGIYYAAVLDIKKIFKESHKMHVIEEYEIYVQLAGDREPHDIAFFVASKLAFWCLVDRYRIKGSDMDIFMQWYELALSLRPRVFETYWFVCGELTLVRITVIVNHHLMDQTLKEKTKRLTSMEKHMNKLWHIVRAQLPVLEPEWGTVARDMNMSKNNLEGGKCMQFYNDLIVKLDFMRVSKLIVF